MDFSIGALKSRTLPHRAAVHAKPEGRPFVDTFAAQVDHDTWGHFPRNREPGDAMPGGGGE